MNLDIRAQRPMTRDELGDFIADLALAAAASGHAWTNSSLDRYLEAASAWLLDMDGFFQNTGKEVPIAPTWQLIAQLLLAARHYE